MSGQAGNFITATVEESDAAQSGNCQKGEGGRLGCGSGDGRGADTEIVAIRWTGRAGAERAVPLQRRESVSHYLHQAQADLTSDIPPRIQRRIMELSYRIS